MAGRGFTGHQHTEETKQKISAGKKGISLWPNGRSAKEKMKIAEGNRGKKHTWQKKREYTLKSCGKRHQWCITCNPAAGEKQAARLRREHAAGLRSPAPGRCTGIQQKLIAFLRAAGYEGLEMEIPFGRYRVDVYCRSRHLAFEADGEAWHEGHPFRDQISLDLRRDEFLLREFNLPTVRLTGSEIEELMSCKPEHASKTEKEEARRPLPTPAPVREPELVGAR